MVRNIKFFFDTIELVSFKVNKSNDKLLTKIVNNKIFVYRFDFKEEQRIEKFNNFYILEFIFRIKQIKIYNSKKINVDNEEHCTNKTIIYYDKNKLNIIFDIDRKNFKIEDKNNEIRISGEEIQLFWILYNEKIQFSLEEEKIIKKKYTKEELEQINLSLEKIKICQKCSLIHKKINYNFDKNKKLFVTGSFLIINSSTPLIGTPLNLHCEYNIDYLDFKYKEITVNENKISQLKEKNEMDKEKDYFYIKNDLSKSCTACNLNLKDKFNIIEFKIEVEVLEQFRNDKQSNRYAFNFDFSMFFDINSIYGTSFKFEIIPNDNKIYFYRDDTKIKGITQKNLIVYSGLYDIKEEDFNKEEFIKEAKELWDEDISKENDKNIYDIWYDEKLKQLIPHAMSIGPLNNERNDEEGIEEGEFKEAKGEDVEVEKDYEEVGIEFGPDE